MKKLFWLIAIVIVFGAVCFVCWKFFVLPHASSVATSSTVATSTAPQLAADVLPLYTWVEWGTPKEATLEDLSGVSVDSAPLTDVTDIASLTTPFSSYYADKLNAAGWTVDNSRAAGGMGADITVYQKGSDYIGISFNSEFKVKPEGAPQECPCDVTLSVFSGTKTK